MIVSQIYLPPHKRTTFCFHGITPTSASLNREDKSYQFCCRPPSPGSDPCLERTNLKSFDGLELPYDADDPEIVAAEGLCDLWNASKRELAFVPLPFDDTVVFESIESEENQAQNGHDRSDTRWRPRCDPGATGKSESMQRKTAGDPSGARPASCGPTS
jgi:hypothetical protein